jgi:exodeoxyribonuclease-3
VKLVTWNINSLRMRLPRVLDWLAANRPDVLCLQELKLEDDKYPRAELEAAGYRSHVFGQKTYNGVAILVRDDVPVGDVATGLAGFDDDQKRVIAATVDGVSIVCAYAPNGQSVGSDKYAYKLRWCAAAEGYLRAALGTFPDLAFAGDLNIAPEPRDVHDPAAWEGQVLFSPPERDAFARWIALGLKDTFRLFDQPPKTFSWWDYRMLAFPKNMGLRIDHVLASPSLAARCTSCTIDRNARKGEKPSDHAPVIAVFAPRAA